jgi:hypothetical protein
VSKCLHPELEKRQDGATYCKACDAKIYLPRVEASRKETASP